MLSGRVVIKIPEHHVVLPARCTRSFADTSPSAIEFVFPSPSHRIPRTNQMATTDIPKDIVPFFAVFGR